MKNQLKELTKAEEQIMQVLWKIKKGFVKNILDELSDPKPAYNTVSTIVRILEKKQFVSYKSFGKAHEYYPIVTRDEYTKFSTGNLLENYFNDSPKSLLSYFIKEKQINISELEDILNTIKKNG